MCVCLCVIVFVYIDIIVFILYHELVQEYRNGNGGIQLVTSDDTVSTFIVLYISHLKYKKVPIQRHRVNITMNNK